MKACQGPFGKCGKVAKFVYSGYDRLRKTKVEFAVCEDCRKRMERKHG